MIVGQRGQIMQIIQLFGMNSKEPKAANNVKVKQVLLTWFEGIIIAGINIDGKVLGAKAVDIALTVGIFR